MKHALLFVLFVCAVFAGPMDIYVDCEGNTKLDLVFVIDTSGSMHPGLMDIRLAIPELDSVLTDCDVHWGIVTFADSVRGDHDFDTTTPGIDFTADFEEFSRDLERIGCSGGGDGAEEDLDALWIAGHCMNWRADARHIAFLFTDAVFCEIGDPCMDCHSNLTKEECLDTLRNHNILLFTIVRDPLYWSSCVMAQPYHTMFWENAADTTGGTYWNLLSAWQDSLLAWADSMNDFVSESVYIANNLPTAVSAEIRFESVRGIELFDTLVDIGTIAPGDSGRAGFRFAVDDTVEKPAFHVIGDFDGGAHVETLLVTIDSCGCHEAVVNLSPGWNLVSVPSDQIVPLTHFESAVGTAYLYSPVLGVYGDASVLAPGFGYWILSGTNSRVMFGGLPISDEAVAVNIGWNSLGGGSLPFQAEEGLSFGTALWPMHYYSSGGYYPTGLIEVGVGYWLLGTSTGTWQAP